MKVLAPSDYNLDRRLDVDEAHRAVIVTLSRGFEQNRVSTSIGGQADQALSEGPRWFQQMDANSDGHVNEREFLGTQDQFRSLDADKNERIELHEILDAG